MSTTSVHSTKHSPRIVECGPNVHQIYFDDVRAGWEQWILLSSDRHHDNAHTDHSLEQRHLKQALERSALIIDCGDLFDAMQQFSDPRASKDALRMENKQAEYLDSLVDSAAKFYTPYAKNFVIMGMGNHETAILKRHGHNLTKALVRRLNEAGGQVFSGGYGGWVQMFFTMRRTVKTSLNLKYFHGSGGGGPVTRGVIQTNRQAVYLPDADIVLNGHVHEAYHVAIARERLSQGGKVNQDIVDYVRTSTYKQEYGDGIGGWHVERGGAPKPLGAVWLRLFYEDCVIRKEIILDMR